MVLSMVANMVLQSWVLMLPANDPVCAGQSPTWIRGVVVEMSGEPLAATPPAVGAVLDFSLVLNAGPSISSSIGALEVDANGRFSTSRLRHRNDALAYLLRVQKDGFEPAIVGLSPEVKGYCLKVFLLKPL